MLAEQTPWLAFFDQEVRVIDQIYSCGLRLASKFVIALFGCAT